MESQPQNPEFRNNAETFTHGYIMLSVIHFILIYSACLLGLCQSFTTFIFYCIDNISPMHKLAIASVLPTRPTCTLKLPLFMVYNVSSLFGVVNM